MINQQMKFEEFSKIAYRAGFGGREIIVDNFAGGGGASTGIELALGRPVDIAINHDPDAIAMHKANHPATKHYCESVWAIDPIKACAGRPVALAWFSPDCKHFSKAKGGKPVEKKIRGLAWIVLRWAAKVKPRVIMLENVEEFKTWGPVKRGQPVKARSGETFERWKSQLEALGYVVEMRELRACDYGAPTTRKRFFMIARRDGKPIVWPEPTHGAGRIPYRTAAEIIDWSLPCPSIFERERPLAENTMRRIARGLIKFVIDNPQPYIVRYRAGNKEQGIHEPLRTITTVDNDYLAVPVLMQYHSEKGNEYRVQEFDQPIKTLDTSNRFGMVQAFLAKNYGGNYSGAGSAADEPVDTITARDHNSLVAANLIKLQQNSVGQSPAEPIHTVMAGAQRFGLQTSHIVKLKGTNIGQTVMEPLQTITASGNHFGEVRAFLIKYYGQGIGQAIDEPLHTVKGKDTFGLVYIHGEPWAIIDIGFRMLQPHELFAAQGFPADYVISHDNAGNPTSKASQVARCGNAVCPPLAEALVRANLPELCMEVAV